MNNSHVDYLHNESSRTNYNYIYLFHKCSGQSYQLGPAYLSLEDGHGASAPAPAPVVALGPAASAAPPDVALASAPDPPGKALSLA